MQGELCQVRRETREARGSLPSLEVCCAVLRTRSPRNTWAWSRGPSASSELLGREDHDRDKEEYHNHNDTEVMRIITVIMTRLIVMANSFRELLSWPRPHKASSLQEQAHQARALRPASFVSPGGGGGVAFFSGCFLSAQQFPGCHGSD